MEGIKVNGGPRRSWREGDCGLPVHEGCLPQERLGHCQKCGVEALLGDGLCVRCWDTTWTGKWANASSN